MKFYVPGPLTGFVREVIQYNHLLEERITSAVKVLGLTHDEATEFREEAIEFAKTNLVTVLTAVDLIFERWMKRKGYR